MRLDNGDYPALDTIGHLCYPPCMKVVAWGDEIMIINVECSNCVEGGQMSQIGVYNLPLARPERTGPHANEMRLIPGKNVIMMKCQHCGYVALFDEKTLERVKGLS